MYLQVPLGVDESGAQFFVCWVHEYRHISGRHRRRMALGWIMRAGTEVAAALSLGRHWWASVGLFVSSHS